jgi:hypothetical protein
MANNTDLSNLPKTLTVETKVYSDLYMLSLRVESLLGFLDTGAVEIPDAMNKYFIEPLRESLADVR